MGAALEDAENAGISGDTILVLLQNQYHVPFSRKRVALLRVFAKLPIYGGCHLSRLPPTCRIVRLPWVYVRSDAFPANGRRCIGATAHKGETVNLVREPDAVNPHVRFDEREVETEHGDASEAPASESAGNR